MTDVLARARRRYGLAILVFALLPGIAQAHVKWFCGPIDASVPPAALQQVLSPLFFACLAGFATLVASGSSFDALLARYVPASREGDRRGVVVDIVIRVGLAVYAVCLWRDLAVVLWADDATGSVLTPEMVDRAYGIGLLQLAIAGMVLVPRLSLLAAVGLLTLFAIGVARFGAFYMIDYTFFVGLAAYVALGQPALRRHLRLASWRVSILTASLSLSLMWTAVEKFLFPQWTIAVLLHHPAITAGFPFTSVTTIAGFVEFSLSFYLLVGRAVLVRVAAVLLAGVFVMAMPEFGMVDIVGHIPVLIILVATLLQGETRLQQAFRGPASGSWATGGAVLVRYVATLTVLMSLYYGLHAASVWAEGKPVTPNQQSPAIIRHRS
ncbi:MULTISPECIES: hypothetical protein [unclassified Sphingomonas]|uniref:hypothetical protein n=1 Tax=unclassified Sphingomonas TaxID=196159 RepID=UPI00226A4C6E|nr:MULTISPECIES: hypothetical protein [unclassified Sphingomonas]